MGRKELINRKLDSEIKSLSAGIFKMNRSLSVSFRRTHRLGYKNMLHVHIPEKFFFFFFCKKTPLALVLGHVR